jgi:acetyl esterase/lipase
MQGIENMRLSYGKNGSAVGASRRHSCYLGILNALVFGFLLGICWDAQRSLSAQELQPDVGSSQNPSSQRLDALDLTQKPQAESESSQKGGVKIRVKYNVPYCEQGDPYQRCDLYTPIDSGSYPGIIMIHGGAWVAGDKANDSGHARKIASNGYVVMVINYRLAPKHKHPAQIDDCFEALSWMSRNSEELNVDLSRLGVWGYSAGGHLAALVATNPRSDLPRVRACVAGGAPCDLELIPSESSVLAGFLGGTRQEIPDVYAEASPIQHVSSDDPPILLFHGDGDKLVPIQFAERMRGRLESKSVPHEFMTLPRKSHIMAFVDPKALNASIQFFNKHLKALGAGE